MSDDDDGDDGDDGDYGGDVDGDDGDYDDTDDRGGVGDGDNVDDTMAMILKSSVTCFRVLDTLMSLIDI